MEIQSLREENQRLREALAQRASGAPGSATDFPPVSSFFGNIESGERISKFEREKFGASLSGAGGAYADAGRPPKKVMLIFEIATQNPNQSPKPLHFSECLQVKKRPTGISGEDTMLNNLKTSNL